MNIEDGHNCTTKFIAHYRNASISRYSAICEFFQKMSFPSSPLSSSLRRSTHAYSTCASSRPMPRGLNVTFTLKHFVHSSASQWRNDEQESGATTSHSEPTSSRPESKPPTMPTAEDKPPATDPSHLQDYSRFFRQLVQSVPHLTRPTRDDLLNVTSSFWKRLRIRFKWLTIRSFRKFNVDDISAFFSFALVGNTLWILIGT